MSDCHLAYQPVRQPIALSTSQTTAAYMMEMSQSKLCINIKGIMYVFKWRTVSVLTRGLFWCLFPELLRTSGNKHQNNTWVSTETVRHKSAYIILFVTWHKESINDDKNDDLYTSSCLTHSVFVLLMMSQSIAGNVTVTRKLWPDHVSSDI